MAVFLTVYAMYSGKNSLKTGLGVVQGH